jgi:solute carrier family 15 oligopeptide transporter 1
MNGDIGFYTIKPDQMPSINPLLIIIMIPLFESVIYPLFKK